MKNVKQVSTILALAAFAGTAVLVGGVSLGVDAHAGASARKDLAVKPSIRSVIEGIIAVQAERALQAGKSGVVEVVVKNPGKVRASPTPITVEILGAKAARASAVKIGTATAPALAPGARKTVKVKVKVPEDREGLIRMLACAIQRCKSVTTTIAPAASGKLPGAQYPAGYEGTILVERKDSSADGNGRVESSSYTANGTLRWKRSPEIHADYPHSARYDLLGGQVSVVFTRSRPYGDNTTCETTGGGIVTFPLTTPLGDPPSFQVRDFRIGPPTFNGAPLSITPDKSSPFYHYASTSFIDGAHRLTQTEVCSGGPTRTSNLDVQGFFHTSNGPIDGWAHSADGNLIQGTYREPAIAGFPNLVTTYSWKFTATG